MKKLLSNFIVLLSTTLLVKILNFVREVELSIFYGTDKVVDNFVKLSIFPNLILNSIAPALGIYILTKISQSENNTLEVDYKKILGLFLLMMLLSVFNIYYLMNNNITIIINSSIIMFLYLVQVILVYYHQSFEDFKTGALSSSLQALIILTVIFMASILGINNLVFYSITFALTVQIIILVWSINKKHYYVKVINNNDRNFLKSYISIILGIGLIEILSFIVKYFIGQFPNNGYLSIFNYSYKLANLPNSVIVYSFISIIFPKLTKVSKDEVLISLNTKLTNVMIITLSLFSVLCLVFSKDIINLVYGHGSINNHDLHFVTNTFEILIWTMIFVSVLTIQYRVLFLLKKFRIIIFNSLFQILFLILLLLIVTLAINSYILLYYSLLITTFIGVCINYFFINFRDVWIVTLTLIVTLITILFNSIAVNSIVFLIFVIILFFEIKNLSKGRLNYKNETIN